MNLSLYSAATGMEAQQLNLNSFASVNELVTAINVHLAHHNLQPTPYRWKAEGAAILAKIQRARAAQTKVFCNSINKTLH